MNGKIRIFTMVCATLLIVGCENNTPSNTTEAAPAAPVTAETAKPEVSPEQGAVVQTVLDPAQGAPAELSTTTSQVTAAPGTIVMIPVSVKNASQIEFLTGATENRIDFFCEVFDVDGKSIGPQGFPLSASLIAEQTKTYELPIAAPATAGQYTININMVQQGKFFFKDAGVKSAIVTLDVKQ